MLEQVLELFAETASITGQMLDAHRNDWQWGQMPKMGKRYQIAGKSFCNGNQSIDAIKNTGKGIISSTKKSGSRRNIDSRPPVWLKLLRTP